MERIEFEKYLIPKIGQRAKEVRKYLGVRQEDIAEKNRSSVNKLENKSGEEFVYKKNFKNPAQPAVLRALIKATDRPDKKKITSSELIFGNEEDYEDIINYVFNELALSIIEVKNDNEDCTFVYKYNTEYVEIRDTLKRISFFNAELSLLKYDMTKDSFYNFPLKIDAMSEEFMTKEEKEKYYLEKYKNLYMNSIEFMLEKEKKEIIKNFKRFFITKNGMYRNKVLMIGKALTKWINEDLHELMLRIEKKYQEEIFINIGYKINKTTEDVLELILNRQDIIDSIGYKIYDSKKNGKKISTEEMDNKLNVSETEDELLQELVEELSKSDHSYNKIINIYNDFVNELTEVQKEALNIN